MKNNCIFLRVINEGDKETALLNIIDDIKTNIPNKYVFVITLERFYIIPGTPFAYWVSERIRNLFVTLPKFEGIGGTVKEGIGTSDDFRFLRCWWEVNSNKIVTGSKNTNAEEYRKQTYNGKIWISFAKGGDYSPYYSDIPLVINWTNNGKIIKDYIVEIYPYLNGNYGWKIKNEDYFFKYGYFQTLRAAFCTPQLTPKGCIFGHNGFQVFDDKEDLSLLGFMNSNLINFLFKMLLGRTGYALYTSGTFQKIPYNSISIQSSIVNDITTKIFLIKREICQTSETDHNFCLPQPSLFNCKTLGQAITDWIEYLKTSSDSICNYENIINDNIYSIYNINYEDRYNINESLVDRPSTLSDVENEPRIIVASFISYLVGCAFGRWDVRYATGEKKPPTTIELFDPLPANSPGILKDESGLPASEPPINYPIKGKWDGILVEDSGHPDDLVKKVREVIHIMYKEQADIIETEACEILGVKNLNEYFSRSSSKGFFDDHIKKYSKSHRKSPIYIKLSSKKGNYSIWLYYQKINRDTLFIILNQYIDPKIDLEVSKYDESKLKMEKEKDTLPRNQITKLGKEIELKANLIVELKEFKQILESVAQRGYNPDFDDGIILNIAPLYELIPWKEPKKYWDDLEKGIYDWSHIAMKYWPDRVKEKCKKDKSLAITHGLEYLYEAD
jgi:hypothetical protein